MTVEIEVGAAHTGKPLLLYDSVFENGTVTVSSETPDGEGANALEDTTFDFWTPADATASITVDCGSAVECDCLGVAAHTLGTEGASIQVRGSSDGSAWVTISSVSPMVDDTIVSIFPAVSYRYWQVQVTGGPASIGVVKLGKRLIIDGGVISGHVSIDHGAKVELLNSTSIGGQFLGNRIKRVGAETSIDFGLLDRDFVDNVMAAFEAHYNSGRTFFFSAHPTFMPENIGYCWRPERGGELSPTYEEGGELMSVSMDVSAYVD